MDRINRNTAACPETNPYIYDQLTFNKVPRPFGGRDGLSNTWC